jgi:hypothetical protein
MGLRQDDPLKISIPARASIVRSALHLSRRLGVAYPDGGKLVGRTQDVNI